MMILSQKDNNILIKQCLELPNKIRILLYEIINLYFLKTFSFKENFDIYNEILQLKENENIIETDSEKLLKKLIHNLTLLSNITSILKNNIVIHNNNEYKNVIDSYDRMIKHNIIKIIIHKINNLISNNIKNDEYSNIFNFEDNIYAYLIEKQKLIEKYFKLLKIQINFGNKKKSHTEIKIIINNLFMIKIKSPIKISKFVEYNFEKKFKLKANRLIYSNSKENKEKNNLYLFQDLTSILNWKLKQIIKIMKEKSGNKISFYECFILFLDFVYDYDKIFKIKCEKCHNKIKYISEQKYFSVPLLKIQKNNNINEYLEKLINDIEKGNEYNINNDNKFYFFHKECFNI